MAQRTMPQNEATKKKHSTHNGFPMSYAVATTQRYGDIDPFFYIHTVGGDKIPLQSSHELRSHTLASPLLSGLQMHKEYYEVPMRAILPNTWELIFANPTQGDDVPNDINNPYCSISSVNFSNFLKDLCFNVFDIDNLESISDPNSSYVQRTNWFKYLFLLNKFISNGELLSKLGYRLDSNLYIEFDGDSVNFDTFFNLIWSFKDNFDAIRVTYESHTYCCYTGGLGDLFRNFFPEEGNVSWVSFRRFLEILSDDPSYIDIQAYSNVSELYDHSNWSSYDLFTSIASFFRNNSIRYRFTSVQKPFDFSLLASYQLACAHFYTNDHIDFVYSANLYRNLVKSFVLTMHKYTDTDVNLSFDYNGMSIDYDAFSGYFFFQMCLKLRDPELYSYNEDYNNALFGYFYALFGTRKSLKFGDYFTGARPYPLAVGDVNVEVNNSEVSAIDITRNIQLQRFLNNVNRAGRKFSDYLRSITDGKALPTPTDPKWLASQHYNIGGNEIENTSGSGNNSPQGNIVLNLRSQQSKYSLEYRDSEPSIVIGLCWFDAMRLYSKSNDRHFFREDRFDFFNKDMQYIGDQEIYGAEVSNNPLSTTFAYTLRNMEDKQRVSIATGGFVEALPSWAFVCDNEDSQNNVPAIISPEFIRSTNAEFDRFYKSLTRMDSAGYFHFIIYHYNQCQPVRPMAFAPSIL